MRIVTHANALSVVAVSWLAAIAALGTALVLAVIGQGVGALAGGCGWIGATIPINRQVWALVNQPVLNFSSLPSAGGYWLGSLVLPALAALVLLNLRPRRPGLVGQLTVIQVVWWVSLVAGVWLPLLDTADGHLSRWLMLHRFGPAMVWSVPAAATILAVAASFRLLEIAHSYRSDLSRGGRVATVVIHLVLPVAGWQCLVSFVSGISPLRPVFGLAGPVTAVVVFGWFRFPPSFSRPLLSPSRRAVLTIIAGAALSASAIWMAGRPFPDGRALGVVWGTSGSFNNIRPWVRIFPPDQGDAEND